MGIDGPPFLAIGRLSVGLAVDQFRINDILPEMHPLAMGAFAVGHPGGHFGGGTAVDADPAVGIFDAFPRRRDPGARLAREEEDPKIEILLWIDSHRPGLLREIEAVGGCAVEDGRAHLFHPFEAPFRLARDTGAERKRGGAETLRPKQRPPASPVEAEKRADEHSVVRPYPETPHDPGVRLGDAGHVPSADPEGGRLSRRPRRPLDAGQLFFRHAQIAPERRILRLVLAYFLFHHAGDVIEVFQRPYVPRLDSGLVPLLPVKRRIRVSVNEL